MAPRTEASILHDRILLDGRALEDFRSSERSLRNALELWGQVDDSVIAALYQSAVVAYARPFAQVRGGVAYPTRELKAGVFDGEVHEHWLKLRHRFLAHSDQEAYAPRLQVQRFTHETDDGQTGTATVGVLTCIYSWDGLGDRDYVGRCFEHVVLVTAATHQALCKRQTELLALLQADPDALAFAYGGTVARFRTSPDEAPHFVPLQELQQHAVKAPDEDIGGPDYRYKQSGVQTTAQSVTIALSGGGTTTWEMSLHAELSRNSPEAISSEGKKREAD